jgi:hypothetical protein
VGCFLFKRDRNECTVGALRALTPD